MNKQLQQQQNLKQFMRILDLEMVTLINILNAKGVIYTHYKLKKERENYDKLRQCENIINKG
tara:strand:- start:294 stop:479 length:186 start_codon:yes stop_codon:yes gene_type:complete